MIFCGILLVLTGVVAFFQYVQGFFSATISAIAATIAAIVAMGWYETAVPLIFNAKIFDSAAPIALVVIFAVTYLVIRLVIDALVPGNVRVPFIVDKVGAGLMGLIAALMATGIVAVAADAMPFGPAVGMYARFPTMDQSDPMYGGQNGQMQDTKNYDVYTGDKYPDDANESSVWLRQDDLLAGLIRKVSADDGSLSSGHPFTAVHPDLLDEYYGQRLGIQAGARHTAVSNQASPEVSVKGIYEPPRPIPLVDGEPPTMRIAGSTPVPATLAADVGQIVLVVRMTFAGKDLADDADDLMRYSAASIRLVAGQPGNNVPFKDFYPVATLDNKGIAVACRPDDFLFSDMGQTRTIDFVFLVDRDNVMADATKNPPFELPPGTFVEFKRYAVSDIGGQTVQYGPPPNPDKTPVIRKPSVDTALGKIDGLWTGAAAIDTSTPGAAGSSGEESSGGDNGPTAAASDHPLGDSGLGYISISVSNKLPYPISAGTSNDAGTVQLPGGVGGELDHRQWTQLTVNADTTVDQLAQPPSEDAQELAVDPNTVLVQVECSAPVSGSSNQMWSWGNRLADFALADATGQTFPCVGVWATAQRGTDHYLVVNYKNFDDKNHLQPLSSKKGRPVNVWLAFQVPSGTPIAEIRFSAQTAVDSLNFKAQ